MNTCIKDLIKQLKITLYYSDSGTEIYNRIVVCYMNLVSYKNKSFFNKSIFLKYIAKRLRQYIIYMYKYKRHWDIVMHVYYYYRDDSISYLVNAISDLYDVLNYVK